MAKDLYSILGLSKGASDAEIKSAYRKLAKKHHPDLNQGDAENEKRFKEINAANDILGDPEKRAKYDAGEINAEGQESPFAGFRRGARGGGNFYETRDDGFDLNDLFSEFLGKRKKQQARAGATISSVVDLTFIEAALGTTKRLSKAGGQKFDVNIQAGVTHGQTLRLKGQGEESDSGGPKGDMLLEIHVLPHPYFKRENLDIYVDVPITLDEAVLGAKIAVPTLSGSVQVTVAPMTQSETKLRLKGKGIAQKNGATGDQYLILKIKLPQVNEALSEAIAEWAQKNAYNVRDHLKKN